MRCAWSRPRASPRATACKDLAPYITFGASPRATIHLIEGARALAYLRGRNYVLPEDVADLAPDVLRHRLSLSYEALAEASRADRSCCAIMQQRARAGQAARNPCPTSTHRTPEAVLRRLEWTVHPPARRPAARRLPHAVPRLAGSTSPTCANTSTTTTSAISTGTSPRACTRPTCASINEEREVTAWFLLDLSPVGGLRLAGDAEARRRARLRHRAGAHADAPRQPRRRAALRRPRRHGASRRAAAVATCCTCCTRC